MELYQEKHLEQWSQNLHAQDQYNIILIWLLGGLHMLIPFRYILEYCILEDQ